ncbi:axoneme-associated protein mst101(2)-like isoform X2 [Toxotes jaculatrix]|uniref:axoneme-associated protein mst101(2)-like isoform X2 n=1 Tax=Toxotes jaculatrix TaxID=941984 RepID=UPI001B3B08CE|nr:axoneme-associated protein mst101(2)-like isoform X2 [Toxotes jaculatrix]
MTSLGMRFPVDLLADVSHAELEKSAHNYMNNLLYRSPDSPEHLTVSESTQVTIDISSVGFIPLYGSSDKEKILALFSPSDPFTSVALYLLDQWWAVDDILKTADPARDGVVEVETVGERIVLYILNRVIYRAKEMSSEELPFLCHGENDSAKILWNDGEAVGFYSVKPSGSLYKSFSSRSYQLPVMDSIFVRKCQRGKGFGLQMLEDFVLTFKEDCLGLRYPLTKSMYKVCEKYLCQNPGDTDLLWEVESIGGPNQRTNIARKIQAMDLSASKSLSFTEESLVITEVTEKDVEREAITTQIQKAESMECTVEIVEEVTVLRATKVSEAEEVPVAVRGRSSSSKRSTIAEKTTEYKSEKVIRIEDIEAETPKEQQVFVQGKTPLHNELEQTEGMFGVAAEEKGEDVVDSEPEDEAAMMLDKPAAVLASQDLEETDVTVAPMNEEPQEEDDATQDMKNISPDSQVIVENVASVIVEAEEECQKEDTAILVVSKEELKAHMEAGILIKEGGETETEVSHEKLEERVTQHELSPHVTSEDGEAESKQHSNLQKELLGETIAHDGGGVLRGRTIRSTSTLKIKYTRHIHEVCEEELEKEYVAEENELEQEEITSIKEDVVNEEDLPEEKKQQHEDEQLTNEGETEKQVEPRVKDSTVKSSSTEVPEKAVTEHTKENEDEKVTAELGAGVSAEEIADEQAADKQMEEHNQVEQKETVNKPENEISNHELTVVTEGTVPKAGGSAEDVIPSTAASEIVILPEEAIVPVADEPEQKDIVSDIPKLQKATVILVDLKTSCHYFSMKEAEEKTIDGECAAPEKEQIELVEAEGKGFSSCVAREQTSDPEMLMLEEEDEGKQEDITEKSADAIAKADTVKIKELEEHNSEKEKEKSVSVDEKKNAVEEAPIIEARVLRSARKTTEASCKSRGRSNQQQKEDNIGEGLTKKELDEAETGSLGIEEEMETVAKDALGDDAEENLPPAEVDKAMSSEEGEAAVVETRALRNETKTVTDPLTHKTKRSRKQVDDQEAENSEEEELTVTTRAMRQGRISPSASQKGKSRRTHEQISEEEQSKSAEETAEEKTEVKGAAEERTNEETEEKIEERGRKVKEEATSKREESLEPEIDVQEWKGVAEERQTIMEEQSEVMSNTSAERGIEASGEEYSERKPVFEVEEVELPPVAVTISLRSGGKTSKAPPKTRAKTRKNQEDEEEKGWASAEKRAERHEPPGETRILRRGRKSVSRSCKKLPKTMEEPKESIEQAQVEEEEGAAGLGSPEELPTEGDEGKIPEEDRREVEKEEHGKGVSEEGTMTMTEEEENTAIVAADADDLVQEGKTDPPLVKPHTDSGILTSSNEEVTYSAEDQQSEEKAYQLSDLQRVTVVLVDLKKAHHEVQEERAAVPVERTSAEAEKEQKGETKEEETVTEEHAPGSPLDIEQAEQVKVVVEEERLEDKVEDVVTIQKETGNLSAEETEAKNDDDEEKAPKVTQTRKWRNRNQAVKPTPRRKSAKSRQKRRQEEKEAASEIREEEPVVHVRGKTSVPLTKKCTTRTQKQLQEEEGGEESTGVEEREAEEEEEHTEEKQEMIDQERGETLEEKDASQRVENIETEMSLEKVGTVAEEAVTQQDAPEDGQADSTATVADENTEAPAGQSSDERKTSDEAVTIKDTVEMVKQWQQSVFITEVVETTQKALLTAKDDKVKAISEEEEASPIETRILRSGKKAVRDQPKGKSTQRQDYGQEVEAAEEKSTEDEPSVETRIVRKRRRSAPPTPRHKSKRATQCQEEEAEEGTTPAEETEGGETKAGKKENNSDEKIDKEDDEAQTGKSTEPESEMEKVETVAEESFPEQETVEGEQYTVSQTCAGGQTSVGGSAEETPNSNKGTATDEEEVPVVEPRVPRSGEKAVRMTPRSKTTKSQQEENEEDVTVVEKNADTDEPTETRVVRKGRRSPPSTPRHNSKRTRTQCQPEEEAEEGTTPAEETEGEEEEAGQESVEEKGKKAEEEVKSMETTEKKKILEENEIENEAEGESVMGDADQMNDAMTKEETSTDTVHISSAKVEGTNSAEEEDSALIEKSAAAIAVGSDTAIADAEALVEDAYSMVQEDASAITSRSSRRQKGQGIEEGQQQKEENPEDGETQDKVHPLTTDTAENRELSAHERTEPEETSPIPLEAGPPTEDTAESQAKEQGDSNRVPKPAAEEAAPEEMESPEESYSGESKNTTVDPPVVEGRSLRRRMKTAKKEEDKAEETQLPKRRSIRKRPRVDYAENDEDEGGETKAPTNREDKGEVESDEHKDSKKAECCTDEQIEKDMGAFESTSQKGDVLNLLDIGEEVETAAISQKHEEDEQNISEEEVELIEIGERVLRGRLIPSVIITPQSKPRRCSAKGQKAEESFSDEGKSPECAQKRSLCKRKSTEVTPTRKSKHHSRV